IQGPFDPRAVESLFDWQMMAIQQLSDGLGTYVHGIEPGGNLHALATEQDHGFLSKHDYAWMKQHQGSGTAHEIDQIRNLPNILTDIQLDLYNRAPVVHDHPISAIIGLRAELDAIEVALDGKEDAGAAVPWVRIIDHPTTLAGYGIVDGASIPFVEGKLADVADELATKADKATTYTKYEVDAALFAKADAANVYTKSQVDSALAAKANIVDVYTKTQVDSALSTKANIADVYTKTETNNLLGNKADKANTLAGYGITDAYTKNETNSLLVAKADKANTLAGYGITDAYTKVEVDALLSALPLPQLYIARFRPQDSEKY